MPTKHLHRLLAFHAIVTLAAGLVLIMAPAAIPGTVDIQLQPGQFLLCYFLAAAEFALAYLSFYSRKLTDPVMLRLVAVTMIIFHGVTLLLELYALGDGLSPRIMANIVARAVIIGLFFYYGMVKLPKSAVNKPEQGI
ncbi:hypothetical protein [Chitinophaga alhagiae]|uniref:hypothetical protein n=1 Tax=Chitinophaga alhagiae TaxID=2203219 RepID=UPI000E5ADA78|nr:hypothetical protein [Chitinophaga alhagiae]